MDYFWISEYFELPEYMWIRKISFWAGKWHFFDLITHLYIPQSLMDLPVGDVFSELF